MKVQTGSKQIVANTWSDEARRAAAEARRAHAGGGSVKMFDSAIGAEKAKAREEADWGKIVEHHHNILETGPQVFPMGEHMGGKVQSIRTTEIKEHKQKAIKALKEAGYVESNRGKMIGGSETLHIFSHPDYPNHKYKLHIRPRTVMGQKEASLTLSVE